jgi:hypothetical protein
MCYDHEGNFMGCYAPEYCKFPEDNTVADDEEDRHAAYGTTREEAEAMRHLYDMKGKNC